MRLVCPLQEPNAHHCIPVDPRKNTDESASAMEVDAGAEASTAHAAEVAPEQTALKHMVNVHNFTKLHRCRRSYCLCQLRKCSDEYRECAKGGFGPEAPLINHNIQGPMRPETGGGATVPWRNKGLGGVCKHRN